MLYTDKEIKLVNYFRDDIGYSQWNVSCYRNIRLRILLNKILKRKNWIDTSGKGDIPPDFYSPKYKLMMEVMRVDDTTRRNKKNKKINPMRAKERDLFNSSSLANISNINDTTVFINADTGLPAEKDHNYKFYKKNFTDVITRHIENIENYRKNHDGYKLIFFIFDESSAYFLKKDKGAMDDDRIHGFSHNCYIDEDFIKCFSKANLDYIVWYTPYKMYETKSGRMKRTIPKAALFDVKKLVDLPLFKYNENVMESI